MSAVPDPASGRPSARWCLTYGFNRHARVAAGEPRGARESVTPQGVAGSTPAPGSTCTASLCEHGIGAVGELWGVVLPGPVELVPGKTIAECIAERATRRASR